MLFRSLPASVGRPQSIVVADKDTNSLTVRDTAENVKLIGDLLESIDKDRAEVVMDVDIYEVNRSSLLQIGNQMGAGNFNLGGSPGLSVLTSNGTTNPGQSRGVDLRSIVGLTPTGAAAALVIPSSVLTAFQSKNNSRLLASRLIGYQDGPPIELLKKQVLLEKDVVQRPRCRYIPHADVDISRLSKRLPIKNHVEVEFISHLADELLQIAIPGDDAHWLSTCLSE